MNLIDAYVTKVLGRTENDFGNGPVIAVSVEYDGYGRISETEILFWGEDREEKAAAVKKGYHFLT